MLTEIQSLAESIGPYGVQYLGDCIVKQGDGQVDKIKILVE